MTWKLLQLVAAQASNFTEDDTFYVVNTIRTGWEGGGLSWLSYIDLEDNI